ncbi:MAG: branched-chain amino acid ABC transporter permease [Syntrophorhabdales bacterium]|jgi:branched-chain amino acid transport system permease protein
MTEEVTRRKERIDRGIKVRSDTVYAVSSWKEIFFLLAPRAGLIIALAVAPFVVPSLYWQRVICIMGVYALLAIGFDFLAHFVGLVSLGGALFIGVGAYVSGCLNHYFGFPPVLTICIATIGGAFICTLILLPTLPLRGVYFAIITFTYPIMAERIIVAANILGGTDGIPGLDVLSNTWVNQYSILAIVLLSLFGLRRLVNEDIGVVFRGVKDNDQAIRASGLSVIYYKSIAVFLSAMMGCFGGAYLAHLYGWVGTSLFSLDFSVFPLVATVVGGPGTLAGPLLGCMILVPISEMLRAFGALRIVIYSLIMVVFILFWSEGLLNWARRKYEQFERWVRV